MDMLSISKANRVVGKVGISLLQLTLYHDYTTTQAWNLAFAETELGCNLSGTQCHTA